jgi:pimeloyl-ACP methyl ester carboxylesterase
MHTFSGRTIDVPSMFIGGKSDWGVYQTPGAAERMQKTACTRMVGFHLVEGAGHWVQQEQPEKVTDLLTKFLQDQSLRDGQKL